MQKRILTINEIYSDNIGDQAIAEALRKFCQVDQGIQVDSVDFSFRKFFLQHKANNSIKKYKRTLRAYVPTILKKVFFLFKNFKNAKLIASLKYDLAIIGGGQLILGKGSFPYSLFLYTYFLKRQGTKIKLVSVGVGENFNEVEKYLIKKSLNIIDSIYLRDKKSIDNLRKIFNKESKFSPDIAYYLHEDNYNYPILKTLKSLICPVAYSVYKRYEKESGNQDLTLDEYKNLWISFIRERLQIFDQVFLSATTIIDFEFTCELKKFFTFQEQKKISFKICQSFHDFIDLAKESSEVLSGRMHALILSHNLGLKIFPFEISKKLQTYNEEYLNKEAKDYKYILLSLQSEILK